MGTATMTASSARSREGKQRSEGEGGPESEGEVRGGRGRLRGVARKSGRLPRRSRRWRPPRARVRAVSVLLAEEEEDKGEEEVGWAGQMGWPAGPGKWRQVIPFSLCLFLIISVFYFAGLF